jgi:hypothetical protein
MNATRAALFKIQRPNNSRPKLTEAPGIAFQACWIKPHLVWQTICQPIKFGTAKRLYWPRYPPISQTFQIVTRIPPESDE